MQPFDSNSEHCRRCQAFQKTLRAAMGVELRRLQTLPSVAEDVACSHGSRTQKTADATKCCRQTTLAPGRRSAAIYSHSVVRGRQYKQTPSLRESVMEANSCLLCARSMFRVRAPQGGAREMANHKQKSPASDWPLARGERPITGRRFVARDPCAGLGCLTEGDGESTRCVRGLRMNYSGSVTQEREVRHYSQAGCRSMLQPQEAVFPYFSTWWQLSFVSADPQIRGVPATS